VIFTKVVADGASFANISRQLQGQWTVLTDLE